MQGKIAEHFANLLRKLWAADMAYVSPSDFKWIISKIMFMVCTECTKASSHLNSMATNNMTAKNYSLSFLMVCMRISIEYTNIWLEFILSGGE